MSRPTLRGSIATTLRSIVALGLACFAFAHAADAHDALIADEYQIKAAFLYKFIDYIEWPPDAFSSADAPLVVGVLGAEPVADFLAAAIAAKKSARRPIEIRRLNNGDTLNGFHVLFVGKAAEGRLDDVLAKAATQSILVVTESEGALARGSTINFVIVDDKVRFDVAPPAPGARNLKVSARLLSVARKVVTRPS